MSPLAVPHDSLTGAAAVLGVQRVTRVEAPLELLHLTPPAPHRSSPRYNSPELAFASNIVAKTVRFPSASALFLFLGGAGASSEGGSASLVLSLSR